MKKWARLENGIIREIIEFDPSGKFPAHLIWIEVTAVTDAREGRYLDTATMTVRDPLPVERSRGAVLTRFEFRQLFTFAERVAIEGAAENVTLTPPQKIVVRTLLADLQAAEGVSLDHPAVAAALAVFVSYGLLTPTRADQIQSRREPHARS